MAKIGRLLIADDEVDIVELLSALLEGSVAEIQTASNGQEALEKAKATQFDAILSDIAMPKLNGIEFLRALREAGILTPFIVLTGHGDKKAAIEALKLNAYDFLEKPWNPTDLQGVITRAIELGQQYNEWKSHPDMMDNLQNVRSENAIGAIFRIKNSPKG